ncbi:MAG TPA: hypothetical protein VFY71_00775 [Planctomycetota bacterium]|nr:hypothetical protein [Planctomycetota bacterium]
MKHGAFARSAGAFVVWTACLATGLPGCAAYQDKHFFDPQDTRIFDQPLTELQPSVPTAFEQLGVTLESQEVEKGKLSFHGTSASGLGVMVQLEAMTTRKTQLAVWVYGHSNFGDWLASEIADAIADEADRAMESASQAAAR